MATINDYLERARILLQDRMVGAYRYPDSDLLIAFDSAIREAKRLRPDMFITTPMPAVMGMPVTTVVTLDDQYMSSFVYYIVGWVQLQDMENTQDARASVFLNKFVSQLLTPAA